jgi:hypothetical protein
MRYNVSRHIVEVLCGGVLVASTGFGQQVGIYLSMDWNQETGDVAATAQATADYSTAYYYNLCTSIFLVQTVDTGDQYYSYSTTACDSSDAEVDWNTTVTTSQ